jgi:hypothetical protein
MDAFQEFYHAPVLHANQSPTQYLEGRRRGGFEAPHYRIEGRTGWSAPRVSGPGRWTPRCASRWRTSARADCSGLGQAGSREMPRAEPGEMRSVGP